VAKKIEKVDTFNEVLWTMGDVAQYLQVAERTIYNWSHSGQIPGFKVGHVWRYKKSDLDEWIESCRNDTVRSRSSS